MILIYGKGRVSKGLEKLLSHLQISYEIKDDGDTDVDLLCYEAIIPSPGIPPSHAIYKSGKIIGELDFCSSYFPKDISIIAVTGTDGKSSTTWMLYHLISAIFPHKNIHISGNFEYPLSDTIAEILMQKKDNEPHVIILEVSSFMAHNIHLFTCDYSIITNLESDHLNWHSDLNAYFLAKGKLLQHTKKKSIITEGVDEKLKQIGCIYHTETSIYGNNTLKNYPDISLGRENISINSTQFRGKHNALNIEGAYAIASEYITTPQQLEDAKNAIAKIPPLPHRGEIISTHLHRIWREDSKSTSCQSLMAALSGYDKPVILIAGGSNKGDPFDHLELSLAQSVSFAVLIGETRDILARKCLIAGVTSVFCEDMPQAVRQAFSHSHEGDTIILSPGCASFDMFHDYLDRAVRYADAIDALEI